MNNSEIKAFLKAIDAGGELNSREALALLLDGITPSYSGFEAADNLLSRFGSLAEICDMSYTELARVEGVGLEGARLIKACHAAVRSFYRGNSTEENPRLYLLEEMVTYLRPNFMGIDSEYFYIFLLNEKYRLIHGEMLGRGNYEQVPFNFRRIIKLIGKYDASKVIFAHNHKASVLPSDVDTVLTNKLNVALHNIDVDLVDHIIFCENEYKSMRESGYIKEIRKFDTFNYYS